MFFWCLEFGIFLRFLCSRYFASFAQNLSRRALKALKRRKNRIFPRELVNSAAPSELASGIGTDIFPGRCLRLWPSSPLGLFRANSHLKRNFTAAQRDFYGSDFSKRLFCYTNKEITPWSTAAPALFSEENLSCKRAPGGQYPLHGPGGNFPGQGVPLKKQGAAGGPAWPARRRA